MFEKFDLLQLILLFTASLWCLALLISFATRQAGGFMTWTGNTLHAMRHAWQLFLGLAIGYVGIYATSDLLIAIGCLIILFPLLSMLAAAAVQRHAQCWKWLGKKRDQILKYCWQLIVGILLGYFLHSSTLVTLHFGGY
jgi:hypothetical protein